MLKVLLVDDEPFILQGLRAIIDWESAGFCIAGTAENGKQALEFLETKSVDLIIADIRMPEMNGLELLELIKVRHLSNARFVLLSGMCDFAFAQKAIRLQCTEYILKPVQKSSLLELLNNISNSVEKEKQQQQESSQMKDAFYARSTIALLMGKYDNDDLNYVRQRLGKAKNFQYIGIEIGDIPESQWATDDEKRAFQHKLYRTCLDFIGERGNRHCIFGVTQRRGCYDVGIIYCSELCSMDAHTFLEQLRASLLRAVQHPILYYIGCCVHSLEELSESYRTAMVARTCQVFVPGRNVVWYENKMKNRSGIALLNKQILDTLVNAVAANDKEGIKTYVSKLYEQMRCSDLDENLINLDIDYFLYNLLHLASQQDNKINQDEVLRYISESTFGQNGMYGSESHFCHFVMEYSDYLSSLRGKSAHGLLGSIERDIESHYAEDISLKTLGEKYYLNSAYLGQLFKKEFGVSFKTYLTNLRVAKAAQLLLQTDEKVYSIAERVGYRDIDYFIDRFVEIKGCTPTKFRRQVQENENIPVTTHS